MSHYVSYLLNVLITYGILFVLLRLVIKTKLLLLPLALFVPGVFGVLNLYFGLWQPFSSVYGAIYSRFEDAGAGMVKYFWPVMEGVVFTSFLWLIYDIIQQKRYHSH